MVVEERHRAREKRTISSVSRRFPRQQHRVALQKPLKNRISYSSNQNPIVELLKESCNEPLGLQSGLTKDSQLLAISVYNDDLQSYGAQHARLNSTMGYRGNMNTIGASWVEINLKRRMVITRIDTRGYGDESTSEWVTSFTLYYASDFTDELKDFKNSNGAPMSFQGNKDRHTVRQNKVPIPVIATKVMFFPTGWNQNVGLRMELYGCEPGYSFTVWLMAVDRPYTIVYYDETSQMFMRLKDEIISEINAHFGTVPGFFSAKLVRFSPQKSSIGFTRCAAEVEIACLPHSRELLIGKLHYLRQNTPRVFDLSFMELQYFHNCDCRPPHITLEGMNRSAVKANAFYSTTRLLILRIMVQRNCNTSNNLLLNCEISPQDKLTTNFYPYRPLRLQGALQYTFDKSGVYKTNISVPSALFKRYEMLYVRCVAQMIDIEGTINYDYGFLRIVKPPLVARILGKSNVVKGKESIVLDGSMSFDPVRRRSGFHGLTFHWFCRRESERFPKNTKQMGEASSGSLTNYGGCFGYGPGKLNLTTRLINIDTRNMEGEAVYVFKLMVSKGKRNTSRLFRVKVESLAVLNISCTRCGEKISPQETGISLDVTCAGLNCMLGDRYKWAIHKPGYKSGKQRIQLKTARQRMNTTRFIIDKVAALGPYENGDQTYEIKVHLLKGLTTLATASEFLVVNSVPRLLGKHGGCFVLPPKGIAISTVFQISCKGWYDEDLPLTYRFHYYGKFGMVILASGTKQNVTTNLPPGVETDCNLRLEVLITDSLGDKQRVHLSVKVTPWKQSIRNLTNTVAELLDDGDIDKAAERALSVMRTAEKVLPTDTDRTKVIDIILTTMLNVTTVMTLSQVTKIVAVVAMATNQHKVISQSSQIIAIGILRKSTNAMLKTIESGKDDIRLVANITSSILQGLDNIINSSIAQSSHKINIELTEQLCDFEVMLQILVTGSGGGFKIRVKFQMPRAHCEAFHRNYHEDFESPVELGDEYIPGYIKHILLLVNYYIQETNIINMALEMTNTVADTLLSFKVAGDRPTVVKSKNIAILVYRETPEKMNGKTLQEGGSGVQFPSASELFGKTNGTMEYVDVQMITHAENPFRWDRTATNVKTSVLDIVIRTNNKKKLHISNLKEPVVLIIPTKRSEPFKSASNKSTIPYFVKPSNDSASVQYHSFYIVSDAQVATLTIKPELGRILEIYVSSKVRPTVMKNTFSTKVPDNSACKHPMKVGNRTKCGINPYTFSISSTVTGATGRHYIGIRYSPSSNEVKSDSVKVKNKELTQVKRRIREKRSCLGHNGRVKRSCVGVKDPPTTPPFIPKVIVPVYNVTTDVNYTLEVSISACVYWSEEKENWTTTGCRVALDSTPSQLHCLCNHLSVFGGDFFVAPNPIDFNKVFLEFTRLGETGNFVVLSTVCVLWFLYFLGLMVARRADKNDRNKIIVSVLPHSMNTEGYKYKLSIQTGMWYGSGTTSNVHFILYGMDKNTETILLTNRYCEKEFFARSSVNNFLLTLPASLGPLYKIQVWHDNSGNNPSWFLADIFVIDLQTEAKSHFVANQWLAIHKGTHEVECSLEVTKESEKLDFNNLFHSRMSKRLGESHLWVSLFCRPPHNPFTRCQRLSCCLSILFAAMVTNAMFYRFGVEPDNAVQIGQLKISWTECKIGMQSALIALPVNVILVLIFRNIRPTDTNSKPDTVASKARSSGCLPHFFLYIGWTICILSATVSSVFVVFYSLMWGADTANQWLVSIMISFFQDVILMQPIKVIVLVTVLSLIFKRPDEHEEVRATAMETENKIESYGNGLPSKPSPKKLQILRSRKIKELKLLQALVEITLFTLFLVLLVIVVHGNRGVTRFMMTDSFKKAVTGFDSIRNESEFWNWTKSRFLPGLYDSMWYNGQLFEYPEGFIANKNMFMVGMPRIRQLRVKPELCLEEADLAAYRHFRRCIPFYTDDNEETSRYNLIGWTPLRNETVFKSFFQLDKLCPRSWRYRTAEDLKVLPFRGEMFTYSGGGYVADLGYNIKTAKAVVKELEENQWIDDLTSVVILEITVFEPSSQLFTSAKLLYERLPTGGVIFITKIDTITIYFQQTRSSKIYMICQPIFMIVVLLLFTMEIIKILKEGLPYFKSVWNWFSLLESMGSMAAVVIFFLKQRYASAFVKRVQQNPYETTSADNLILWSEVELYTLSAVIFVATMKCLRIIRFNRHICQMTTTLRTSARFLLSYLAVFIVLIMAFCIMAATCFGSVMPSYSSFFRTLGSLLQLLIGGRLQFTTIRSVDPILGPIFTITYLLTANIVLINVFVVILNDSYGESRQTHNGSFEDADLGSFLFVYLNEKMRNFERKIYRLVNKLTRKKVGRYDVKAFHTKRDPFVQSEAKRKSLRLSYSNVKITKSAFRRKKSSYDIMLVDMYNGYHYGIIPNEIYLGDENPGVKVIAFRPFNTSRVYSGSITHSSQQICTKSMPSETGTSDKEENKERKPNERSIERLEGRRARLASFDADDMLVSLDDDSLDSSTRSCTVQAIEEEFFRDIVNSLQDVRSQLRASIALSITDSLLEMGSSNSREVGLHAR